MQVPNANRHRHVRRRLCALVALLAAVMLIAACTSSSTSRPRHSQPPGSPVPASKFADALTRGSSTLSPAHLQMRTRISGQVLPGSGDVRFADGAVQAADVRQQLPAGLGQVEVVLAEGTTYAKLPPALRSGKATWSVVDGSSANAGVGSLGTVISSILSLVTPHGLITLADAAGSVTESSVGAHATRYALRVDPAEVGSAAPALSSGKRPIVLQISLDDRDRPTQVSGSLDLLGQRVSPHVVLSRFGEPVSITAPKN